MRLAEPRFPIALWPAVSAVRKRRARALQLWRKRAWNSSWHPPGVETGALSYPAVASLLRKNPADQRLDVGVGHLRIGRHGHLTPYALAALLDLVEELRRRVGIAAVFGRNVLV